MVFKAPGGGALVNGDEVAQCTRLFDRNKKEQIASDLIHISYAGNGDGGAISVGVLVDLVGALLDSVGALVDDKEGSDADGSSHRDSAPHHL